MKSTTIAAIAGAIIGLGLFTYAHADTAPPEPSQVGNCMTLEEVKATNPPGSTFVRLNPDEYANLDRSTHLPDGAAEVFIGHLPEGFAEPAGHFLFAFVFNDRGCLIAKGVFEPMVLREYLRPLPPT